MYRAEAAVELLIGHEWWLHRDDFVNAFVGTDQAPVSGTPVAFVDWPAAVAALDAARLPCSRSEAQILRVAASIAAGVPVDVGGALVGLDERTARLVAAAVLHAVGGGEAVSSVVAPRW